MITYQNGELFYNGEKVKPGFSFSQATWQARLDGRKTMTRRLHKEPRFKIGDLVYVKEPLRKLETAKSVFIAEYLFDHEIVIGDGPDLKTIIWRWQRDRLPGIFMPAMAARFVDRIINVRQERLQEITEKDIKHEGIVISAYVGHLPSQFRALWNSIYPKQPWASNPEVVVYEWEMMV